MKAVIVQVFRNRTGLSVQLTVTDTDRPDIEVKQHRIEPRSARELEYALEEAGRTDDAAEVAAAIFRKGERHHV